MYWRFSLAFVFSFLSSSFEYPGYANAAIVTSYSPLSCAFI
jgi:hypothetical protein